jgi:hypothetical protein
MKLWLHPYQLQSSFFGPRSGYLLRLEEPHRESGHADIFPWPEFGDPEFKEIPKLLKNGENRPLLQRSLMFARRDARARTEGTFLLRDQETRNHFLLVGPKDSWPQQVEAAFAHGFTTVKVKVGRQFSEEFRVLQKVCQLNKAHSWLRLDFNGAGQRADFKKLSSIKQQIQFIEDPMKRSDEWGVLDFPLAYDQPGFADQEVDYQYRIVKPAKQRTPSGESVPLIFTSYLDHPVGIAHAMVEALQSGPQILDYGLLSQGVYQPTAFHECLQSDGPKLQVLGEKGIGFDSLFAKLHWEAL